MRRAPLLVAGALACAVAAPSADAAGLYVSLGDSYVAGALVPDLVGEPALCGRSSRNYPRLTAAALGYTLRDVSCSGAAIGHMTGPQTFSDGSSNPPQFDALTPDTALVTVGLSANDTGIISVPGDCVTDSDPAPTSVECRRFHQGPGGDVVLARIAREAPRMREVLRQIRLRAPAARVLVMGYPQVTRNDGTNCYPTVPMSSDDLVYSDEVLVANDAMLREQAAAAGVEYVSTYAPGHDICAPEDARWIEGFVLGDVSFPVHPNARGEAGMAALLQAALRTPPPPAAPVIAPPAAAAPAIIRTLRQERPARRTGPPPRFAVTVSAATTVRFRVERRDRSGRYGGARRFQRRLRAGTTRVHVQRAALGRRPGTYRLTATPFGAANGAPVTVTFRLR